VKEEALLETASSQCKFLNHLVVSLSVLAFLTILSKSPPDTAEFVPALPHEAANYPYLPMRSQRSASSKRLPLRVTQKFRGWAAKRNWVSFHELEPDFSLSDLLFSRFVHFALLKCVKTW